MKAILEFSLPEDDNEFKLATKAVDMSLAIWELKQWFRSKIKYSNDDVSFEQLKAIKDCQTAFFECLENNNVNDLD